MQCETETTTCSQYDILFTCVYRETGVKWKIGFSEQSLQLYSGTGSQVQSNEYNNIGCTNA